MVWHNLGKILATFFRCLCSDSGSIGLCANKTKFSFTYFFFTPHFLFVLLPKCCQFFHYSITKQWVMDHRSLSQTQCRARSTQLMENNLLNLLVSAISVEIIRQMPQTKIWLLLMQCPKSIPMTVLSLFLRVRALCMYAIYPTLARFCVFTCAHVKVHVWYWQSL